MPNRSKLVTSIPSLETRKLFEMWPQYRHNMVPFKYDKTSIAFEVGCVPYVRRSDDHWVEDEAMIVKHVEDTGTCPFEMMSDEMLSKLIEQYNKRI